MFNQLFTEIKEDLKQEDRWKEHIRIFGNNIKPEFSKLTNTCLLKIVEERIKTKLQEWHRMAEIIENYVFDDINEYERLLNLSEGAECMIEDLIRYKREDLKELSTFIQEIEKIAKEQGVELK